MDRNFFIAITLCAGIYFSWYTYNEKHFPKPAPVATEQSQLTNTAAPTAPAAPTQGFVSPNLKQEISKMTGNAAAKSVVLGDQSFQITVNTAGGLISSSTIAEYRGRKTENLATLIGSANELELSTPAQEWAYLSNVTYEVKSQGKNASGFEELILNYADANVSVERKYVLNPKLYFVDHDISINFKKQQPAYVFVGLNGRKEIPKIENERREILFAKIGSKAASFDPSKIDEIKEDLGEGKWIALTSRYFMSALVDRGSLTHPQFQARPLPSGEFSANLIYKVPTNSLIVPLRYYYGPKEVGILKLIGNNLDASVDFGWFTIFAIPLLNILKWLHVYVKNYGIAIILLTVLVKLVLYPLTFKSMKGMKEMQKIQPQMNALRERYKDDKETLNREMMGLMKTHGYNPMSGCLPMFVQMPIFIALYNVLYGAIDLYGQPFFGWIHDLSAKDPFFVTPILLAVMMFVQQKITPNTAADPAQQKMMMFMPLIFAFMMLWLPSGLTLYMLVNSITSIIQQAIINKKLGITRPAST